MSRYSPTHECDLYLLKALLQPLLLPLFVCFKLNAFVLSLKLFKV